MIIAWEKKYKDVFLAGNRTYFAAISLFRSRLSSRATKIVLYKTLIRQVVSCGAEAWTLTKKEKQTVLIFERKIFRRIYGPKYEKAEWESRTNREIEEMGKGENIVKWIKGQRISWLGQLERMEEDRIPKKIFIQELEGTRRMGRPRKRWKEEVERDLHVLGVRRWRELVADRKKWKDIVRQAKAHSGLQCQWKKKKKKIKKKKKKIQCGWGTRTLYQALTFHTCIYIHYEGKNINVFSTKNVHFFHICWCQRFT